VPLQATIRQDRSPARLLPRVVGLSTASIPVAAPVGALATGLLIDRLGLHSTLVVLTAGAVLLGAAVLTSRATRCFDRNQPVVPVEQGLTTVDRRTCLPRETTSSPAAKHDSSVI
jgi:hypothetical protein